MSEVRVQVSSRLTAPAASVWARVTTLEGIAEELSPWLRMTAPPGLRHAASPGVTGAPVGVALGRSWLLLGGVLPVEYDDMTLDAVGERSFVEVSTLGSARSWRHERVVADHEGGSVLTDTLTLEPRRMVPVAVARSVVTRLFEHRHARLRRRFGGGP